MDTTRNHMKGFSIVEALVSMILLVIMMTGGMAFYNYASKHAAEALHQKIALQLAESEMERLRSSAFPPIGGSTNVTIRYLPGIMTTTVLDSIGAAYRHVDVRVSWTEPGIATNREINLQTYIGP